MVVDQVNFNKFRTSELAQFVEVLRKQNKTNSFKFKLKETRHA